MKNPAISQMKGVNEREIRRYLLYPSWAICIGSAAGFIWQVGRTDSFTRLDVLLIVSFAFLYLLGLGLVLFANLVAAMARVFEKYDQPKP